MDAPNDPDFNAADITDTPGNADSQPADSVGQSSGSGLSAPENPIDPSANPTAPPASAPAPSSGNPVSPSAGPTPPPPGNSPAPEDPDHHPDDSIRTPPPVDPPAVPPPAEPTNPQSEDDHMDTSSDLTDLLPEGDSFNFQRKDVCANHLDAPQMKMPPSMLLGRNLLEMLREISRSVLKRMLSRMRMLRGRTMRRCKSTKKCSLIMRMMMMMIMR